MNKQKKNSKNKAAQHKWQKIIRNKRMYLIVIPLLLVGIAGLFFWNIFLQKSNVQVNSDGYELIGETFVANGQVTQKRVSCGGEELMEDGSVRRGGGICDAGNSLEIDDSLRISTGGGALTSRKPKYISDIESISAGDRVEIRYAKDDRGYASTNCELCYIKKLQDYGVEATFSDGIDEIKSEVQERARLEAQEMGIQKDCVEKGLEEYRLYTRWYKCPSPEPSAD